ncbi:AraC family transcriptional regulator [Mitsuaria sp. GD03876]|uniref:AraC family transcriptional regulator n=1 Tax=Mitsuaria sp. GD03876 TaxID=2975399 RepID=UPI00244C1EAD|nr:AraC family transcriptional regulator [Mitsuaria sp. GD03876]MDH0863338.1 AraC family transcriptional regulator [Mitsuaria sp. GD03876]
MTSASSSPAPRILSTSAGRDWRALQAHVLQVSPGRFQAPASDRHRLGLHLGAPVNAVCACDGVRLRRVQRHGDIDLVPAGTTGSWEDDAECRILQLSVAPALLGEVAEELGRPVGDATLRPRLQWRDDRVEAIAWAIKAELDADTPSDPLYVDLLAHALAIRLIDAGREGTPPAALADGPRFTQRQLRALTEFIDHHLDRPLRLAELAAQAGVSGTRLKTLFRNSTGLPVHQYVIRRRVEHARALLATTGMAASEVALAAGFSHQSHMSHTMRRLLGHTPGEVRRRSDHIRPKLQPPD